MVRDGRESGDTGPIRHGDHHDRDQSGFGKPVAPYHGLIRRLFQWDNARNLAPSRGINDGQYGMAAPEPFDQGACWNTSTSQAIADASGPDEPATSVMRKYGKTAPTLLMGTNLVSLLSIVSC